jgi:hypothetical protein
VQTKAALILPEPCKHTFAALSEIVIPTGGGPLLPAVAEGPAVCGERYAAG